MPDDVEAISRIPLPRRQKEDEMMWGFNKIGEYTVKSGYQLALKLKFPDDPSSSESNSSKWKSLWALDLPEGREDKDIHVESIKKTFCQQLKNLWKRKCLLDPIRQSCNKFVEFVSHALQECKQQKRYGI